MTTTEVLEEKGLTVKSVSIGVFFTLLVTFVFMNPAMGYGPPSAWGTYGGVRAIYPLMMYAGQIMYPYALLWLIFIPISVLNQRMAKPLFTKQELTVITVMLFCISSIAMWGGYTSFIYGYFMATWGAYYQPAAAWADVNQWVSPILMPRDKSVYNFLTESYAIGGTTRIAMGAVPWGAWAPTITWLVLIMGGMLFTGLFLVLLFRYLYIEVEAIPFATTAGLQTHLIEGASKVEGAGTWHFLSNKYFLAGIAVELFVGGAFMGIILPCILLWIYGPNYPGRDYLGNTFGINWSLDYEATQLALLPASALPITTPIPNIGWGYLLPLDILITFVVAWIIFNFIIPSVVVSAGMAPRWPLGAGWTQMYANYPLNRVGGWSFQWLNVWGFGLLVGVAVYQVWRHRDSMGPILKSIAQKPPAHIEATSPMPYRWIWIGLLVSGLLWLAMGVAVGGPVLPWLILLAVFMIFFVGYSRLLAETGGMWGYAQVGMHNADWANVVPVFVNLVIWGFGLYTIKDKAGVFTLANMMYFPMNMFHTFMFAWIALTAFKTGKDTGTRKGDILKAVIIVFALYVVLAPIAGFLWGAFFPIRAEQPAWHPGWWYFTSSFVKTGGFVDAGTYYTFTPSPANLNGVLITLVVGIVIVALCYELRRKVRGFWWLNPIAIALACWFGWWGWVGFSIALGLKFLLTKVGGAAAVEKGRLFALGIVTAFFVSVFFKSYIAGRYWWIVLGFARGWGGWPTIY